MKNQIWAPHCRGCQQNGFAKHINFWQKPGFCTPTFKLFLFNFPTPLELRVFNGFGSPKLTVQETSLTLGAPLMGVPAEWFYKTHQFLAKTGILHPHIQTLPI